MGDGTLLDATRRWAEAFAAPMPEGLERLLALASDDIRFTDPFNDVAGKAGLRAILEDMTERCREARFTILDVASSERAGYIRWRFDCVPRGRGRSAWCFEGMSEIHLNAAGKVSVHADHWDSATQLYAKLPVVGWPLRRIRAALTVTPPPE
jgi:steroid delta-isomerase